MSKKPITYAFIDSQNLNLGVSYDVKNQNGKILYHGKKLNHRRFRHYLREKFNVTEAFLFIGYVEDNADLYENLEKSGFTLVYKDAVEFTDDGGKKIIKGNVDADIVLYAAAIKFPEYEKAIVVSGDGDFVSLYDFLESKGKLGRILVPNEFRYSRLLKRFKNKLFFISNQRTLFKMDNHKSDGHHKKDQQKAGSSGRIPSLGMPGDRDNPIVENPKPKVNKYRPKFIRRNLEEER